MNIKDIILNREIMDREIANLDLSGDVQAFKNNLAKNELKLKERFIENENFENTIKSKLQSFLPKKTHSLVSDMVSSLIDSGRELNGNKEETDKLSNLIKKHKKVLDDNENDYLNLQHSNDFLDWKIDNDEHYQNIVKKQESKIFQNKVALGTTLTGAGLLGFSSISAPIVFGIGITGVVLYSAIKKGLEQKSNELSFNKFNEMHETINQEIEKVYQKVYQKSKDPEFMEKLDEKYETFTHTSIGSFDEPFMVYPEKGDAFHLLDKADEISDVTTVKHLDDAVKRRSNRKIK
jgi:hypothetical protein